MEDQFADANKLAQDMTPRELAKSIANVAIELAVDARDYETAESGYDVLDLVATLETGERNMIADPEPEPAAANDFLADIDPDINLEDSGFEDLTPDEEEEVLQDAIEVTREILWPVHSDPMMEPDEYTIDGVIVPAYLMAEDPMDTVYKYDWMVDDYGRLLSTVERADWLAWTLDFFDVGINAGEDWSIADYLLSEESGFEGSETGDEECETVDEDWTPFLEITGYDSAESEDW